MLQSTSHRRKRGRKPIERKPTPELVAEFMTGAVTRIIVAHETCSLDVAGRGPSDARQVARLMGLTTRRVAQVEARALAKLRSSTDPAVARWVELALDAGAIEPEEIDDMTKSADVQAAEAALRQANADRRSGVLAAEEAPRIIRERLRERNAALRAAKKGQK